MFADKAYCDTELNQQILHQHGAYIFTLVKLVKGQSQTQRQFKKPLMTCFQRLFLELDSLLSRYSIG
jgi:hypothetical protein